MAPWCVRPSPVKKGWLSVSHAALKRISSRLNTGWEGATTVIHYHTSTKLQRIITIIFNNDNNNNLRGNVNSVNNMVLEFLDLNKHRVVTRGPTLVEHQEVKDGG